MAGGVGTAVGGVAYGLAYSRHNIQVVRTAIPVSGLSPALDGLRIGLITDLHRSEMVPARDVARAVSLMMMERPDLIVLGGDYVTWSDRSYVVPCSEALAGLAAPFGVYAVLGNHDDDRDMPAALISQGYEVLRDARTTVRIRGEQLDLVGVRFWTRRARDIARLIRGAESTVILLAHDPRRLDQAAALNVPLVFSGHTHGGQVVLPGVGAVAAQEISRHRRRRAPREHLDLRQSRGRHCVCALPTELPARRVGDYAEGQESAVKSEKGAFFTTPCATHGEKPATFNAPSAVQ